MDNHKKYIKYRKLFDELYYATLNIVHELSILLTFCFVKNRPPHKYSDLRHTHVLKLILIS